jgi:hypothetical protein
MKMTPAEARAHLNPVVRTKAARTPDTPIYDAVESLIFGVPHNPDTPQNWSGREGGIARWLTGHITKYSKHVLGAVPEPVTDAAFVKGFVAWLDDTKRGMSYPRDVAKFVQYWREFWPQRESYVAMYAQAQTPAVTFPVDAPAPVMDMSPEQMARAAETLNAMIDRIAAERIKKRGV